MLEVCLSVFIIGKEGKELFFHPSGWFSSQPLKIILFLMYFANIESTLVVSGDVTILFFPWVQKLLTLGFICFSEIPASEKNGPLWVMLGKEKKSRTEMFINRVVCYKSGRKIESNRSLKVKPPRKVKTCTAREEIYGSQRCSYSLSTAQPQLLIPKNLLLAVSWATLVYSRILNNSNLDWNGQPEWALHLVCGILFSKTTTVALQQHVWVGIPF